MAPTLRTSSVWPGCTRSMEPLPPSLWTKPPPSSARSALAPTTKAASASSRSKPALSPVPPAFSCSRMANLAGSVSTKWTPACQQPERHLRVRWSAPPFPFAPPHRHLQRQHLRCCQRPTKFHGHSTIRLPSPTSPCLPSNASPPISDRWRHAIIGGCISKLGIPTRMGLPSAVVPKNDPDAVLSFRTMW